MDKGVTASMMLQVKRKPSELSFLRWDVHRGTLMLMYMLIHLIISSGHLAFTVIRSNDRIQFAKAHSCYSPFKI